MTGCSVGMARRVSSSRFQFSFSVVSRWSVVLNETSSSCAMPVDSAFTLIISVGMSSQFLRNFSPLKSILNQE